jgi:cytochrome oxidase Cu insertion factor (SCO1/SenC/PrrC family)
MVKVCTRDAVTKSVDPARDIVPEQLEKKGDDLLRNTPNMQQLTNEHVQDVMK